MPPIFFNVEKARNYLLKHKFVYTLRKKRKLNREITKARKGSLIRFKILGGVQVQWIQTIIRKEDLKPYLPNSGFDSIDEWLRQVEENAKELYRVDLISRVCGETID